MAKLLSAPRVVGEDMQKKTRKKTELGLESFLDMKEKQKKMSLGSNLKRNQAQAWVLATISKLLSVPRIAQQRAEKKQIKTWTWAWFFLDLSLSSGSCNHH